MTKLLNVANPKTVKGEKQGYLTGVLYLSPYKISGDNLCPFADIAKCHEGCLNTAGRGGMAKGGATREVNSVTIPDNKIQAARLFRSLSYVYDREGFFNQLIGELDALQRKAAKYDLTPVVRLNGTSDILWERMPAKIVNGKEITIFEYFPDLQFYDYTKVYKRLDTDLPKNYHLTLSYSGANGTYAKKCLEKFEEGLPLSVVVRDKVVKQKFLSAFYDAYDGDVDDLRFKNKGLCVLTAKGKARKDTSGFVLDSVEQFVLAEEG